MIPIIYGRRKWGGAQTWHSTSSDKKTLTKDIILCEGEINGITDVKANDLYIETITETKVINVDIKITNPLNKDIEVRKDNQFFYIYEVVTPEIKLMVGREHLTTITPLNKYWLQITSSYPIQLSEIPDIPFTISKHSTITKVIQKSITSVTQQAQVPNCSVVRHYGAYNQAPPSNYTETGGYKNCAWLRCNLQSSDNLAGGNPTITSIIEGRKIYDTRTNTIKYSQNPAMCVRDYILNKRFGLGRWITVDMLDEDSIKECADYCDEVIAYYVPSTLSTYNAVQNQITKLQQELQAHPEYSQETVTAINNSINDLTIKLQTVQSQPVTQILVTSPRYQMNLILNQRKTHIDNLQTMMATFGGFLVYNGNKISLKMEKETSISYAFDDSNICATDDGTPDISWTTTSLADTPNRYVLTFYDPDNEWVGVKCQVNDTADQKLRGKIITKEVTLDGVTSQSQALRLGRIFMAKNRMNVLVVEFKTGTHAMHLQAGDVITVTHKSLSAMPFRILQLSEENGKWTIKAQQWNNSIFDDKLGSQITVKNYSTIPNAFTDDVPEVLGISVEQNYYIQKDGTSVSTITGQCQIPEYVFYRATYVYVSSDDGNSWSYLGTSSDGTFLMQNALVGQTYLFKAIVENTAGRKSNGFISNPIYCSGKDSPPSDVTDFVVAQFLTYFVLQGKIPNDVDFSHCEIRIGGTSWETSRFLATDITVFPSYISNAGVIDGTHIFRCKAVDNGGNYSENDITYILNVSDINSYKNVILTRNDLTDGIGTLGNMVLLPNGTLVNPSAIVYDDDNTWDYDSYPSEYGDDSTAVSYTSPVIDTFKVGRTNVNFCFDFDSYNNEPTYDSIKDRVYDDFPYDTYNHISMPYTVDITVRFSNDNITWSDWQTYVSAEYVFRYIQYKINVTYSAGSKFLIRSLLQYYDVPDTSFVQTISVPIGGISVSYNDIFYSTPEEIYPTAIGGNGNVFPSITNSTSSGLTLTCYDRTGASVAGTVKLVCKGY